MKLIPDLCDCFDRIILTENENCKDSLDRQVAWCKEHYPENEFIPVIMDVTKLENVNEFRELLVEKEIKLDSLIYLAGINYLIPALELKEDVWDKVHSVNLKGFFFMAQAAAENMIQGNGGSIVGIASQHGVIVNDNRAAYCSSKAGMIHLAKELALEWGKYGIRVNTVSPTMILSEKNSHILEQPRMKKKYLDSVPLRKYASPEDICESIKFVISERAGMITGQNIIVDGGVTVK
ncbi:NAD(P)-dependent dehydrogenase, short-chain alcohol dehydrogenase family [Butyrivibrio sp. YAB3001]|nr:NAD(P)-dependent dehydrogenase, short-chain alcohol dehydrogenase family [Butyrivibrio sp. YAB3001]